MAFLPAGGSLWVWTPPGEVKGFEEHRGRMEAEMRAELQDPKHAKHAEALKQALQVIEPPTPLACEA